MKENGKTTLDMAEATSTTQMATSTMDSSRTAKQVEKESMSGPTAKFTMVSGKTVSSMATAFGKA